MIKLNEGDTLAIKIENYNKEFDGKYFLFIKAEDFSEKYDSTASKKLFNTINNLEYIKKNLSYGKEDFIHILDLKHMMMQRKIEKRYFTRMNIIIYTLIYLN